MIKKANLKLAGVFGASAIVTMALQSAIAFDAVASTDADYNFTIAPDWHDCQQINIAYQAVYAFETASFYVNICQKDNNYFYSGEAKQSDNSSIFIPAYPLENGTGFRAENGNVSYLVLLPLNKHDDLRSSDSEPTEAILTIKRNNQLISVESSLDKYCHQSQTSVAWDTIELQSHDANQLATIPQQRDVGLEFSIAEQSDRLLSQEIFNSDSRFDFYRIGGELHRLTTCN